MNPYEEDLRKIIEQAELFARRVRYVSDLYDQRSDPGRSTPKPRDLEYAVDSMRVAFMALLRVTAEYL